MGLAEKREVESFKTSKADGYIAAINEAAGNSIPVDIDWDSLAENGQSKHYADAFPKLYFEPLITALKKIGADQMGKDALKEGLKRIVMKNSGQYFNEHGLTFDNGTLTIDLKIANVDAVSDREKNLQTLIEKKL